MSIVLTILLFLLAVPVVVSFSNMILALRYGRAITGIENGLLPSMKPAMAWAGGGAAGSVSVRPLVSVLIPARNEEKNMASCLQSISRQTCRNMEILVLDDQSVDGTAAVVESMAEGDGRMILLKGEPLPKGWLGKNWACHQLSQAAHGRYLLFIDADVQMKPETLDSMLQLMDRNSSDVLSLFPTQRMQTAGEWLVVPLMNWILLSFLPLRMVYRSPDPAFVAANGQFMLFRTDIYKALDGHRAVRNEIVEDMALARRFKENGKRVTTLPDDGRVFCRMYPGFHASAEGFKKNFFAGFQTTPTRFAIIITAMFLLFTMPLFLVFLHTAYIIAVILMALNRIFTSVASRQNPVMNVLLHPLQMVLLLYVGILSARATLRRKIVWKNRTL